MRDDAWIDAQIAEAERLFGPIGVHFRKAAQRALAERFARLETRRDRDALDAERVKGVVNVFVVAALRGSGRATLASTAWACTGATAGRRPTRYVIVSADAAPSTLAHELGHYDGLAHSATKDNLMSYQRSGEGVFLHPQQARTVRAFARLAFASGELSASSGLSASGERSASGELSPAPVAPLSSPLATPALPAPPDI